MLISVNINEKNEVEAFFTEKTAGQYQLEVPDDFFETLEDKQYKIIEGILVENETNLDIIAEKENQILNLKKYLLDTDYIVIKINEYKLQDKPVDSLLTKYSNELEERKDKRILINTLEQEIQNLKT